MNEIVSKFLLAGDTFMAEMHLRGPGFTCSARGPFTKNKERVQKYKLTGDSRYIYQNKLDKSCFQQRFICDEVFKIKDLAKRTASDKMLRDEVFNFAKNPKYDGHQTGLASMVYKCFDKKTYGSGIKNENMSGQQLAEELHKLNY